ncbi:MAG: UDP-N-acetylmuramoyl-L-alanyl-D-glutamate--2,6-diaminopimelate ligase [Firmicutes bacterium]|nr:UDP-N-acetylmuramoyl-L-alanyl-D-glutamate--2,6-diaminopimelate ligase [Bacillota bacterium]MCM1401073.1 UDP-N-acetylmuramoyl-L-alanyl-D-glutamate--2,6-diaminopimelate ligase [Bacteroides sp.]MCM1476992.1 UDP-N-acetylmuramoyl-L-alanyl-D-glutamate--2,6-diaminopimelate ligase [Bacteroides sp.]
MKSLTDLLSAIMVEEIIGSENKEITSLESDSRKIKLGSMFVAVRGYNVDGHKFIPLVTLAGAAAVVCEELPERIESNVTYIKVANSAIALGYLASQWWGNPSRKLKLVGVTGTNGKTTTATLIYEMARAMGYKAGLLSTVCNYIDSEAVPTNQTTPDPLTLNELLHRMVVAGCSYAAMEVSSHAAHQHRIAGLHFTGAVFSNLTRDHMDYHKTVEAYRDAKKSFFDLLSPTSFALVNADDRNGEYMLQNTAAKKYTYSLRKDADFTGHIIESRIDGTLMQFNGHDVEVMFTGRFNAYNLTAVYGTACLLGWEPEKVLVDMSLLVPVAGRFQTIHGPNNVIAIVDYAHTPDAVVNVLTTVAELLNKKGNIITVVGAGGNRDKGKRPLMAREAARLSDRLVLTSDNPRDEDPEQIIADMTAGLDTDELRARTISITDRREAIRTALMLAKPGDVVLIAGKGHETYQEIHGVKHHFDDREVVAECFK